MNYAITGSIISMIRNRFQYNAFKLCCKKAGSEADFLQQIFCECEVSINYG